MKCEHLLTGGVLRCTSGDLRYSRGQGAQSVSSMRPARTIKHRPAFSTLIMHE